MKKVMVIQMADMKVESATAASQGISQDSSLDKSQSMDKTSARSMSENVETTSSTQPPSTNAEAMTKNAVGSNAAPKSNASTTPATPPTKGKRGGFRVGAGRKPIPEGKHINLLVTATQKETLARLGGPTWLRNVLQAATLDKLPIKLARIGRSTVGPVSIPYLDFSVQAGFPSPAEAYIKEKVDLNQLLVGVPAATFLLRASGNSMISAGISDGDLLVLDRSKEPRHGDIVIMRVNDDFTVKRLYNKDGVIKLEAETPDPAYTDIYPGENDEWVAVGVVTYVIKQV